MIIKSVLIGNEKEAFVENSFSDGFNIIYSTEDNNKGKTILIQSMLYALGNKPIFPKSFPFNEYYHICIFEENSKKYISCRRGSEFILKTEDDLLICENVEEFRNVLNKHVFRLPTIKHREKFEMVYPELFFQIFYVAQDEKNCSSIFKSGFYNKTDFQNLLHEFTKNNEEEIDSSKIQEIKNNISVLKIKQKQLLKQYKDLKKRDPAISQLYFVGDENVFKEKCIELENINNEILDLRKTRNSTYNQYLNVENLIHELNSLNTTLNAGEVSCMQCGSHNISYISKNRSFSFNISNQSTRLQILKTLDDKKNDLLDECEELKQNITKLQIKLRSLIDEKDITLESLLAYKNKNDLSQIDNEMKEIANELFNLEYMLKQNMDVVESNANSIKILDKRIIQEMNDFYKYIDPNGKQVFEGIFTKAGTTYSGSEEMEFYLAKIYAFAKVFEHDFPLIVDSFRDGELTSDKETRIIDTFNNLPNQKIFTSTLKDEEENKYDRMKIVNSINYNSNETSHILNTEDLAQFNEIKEMLMFN